MLEVSVEVNSDMKQKKTFVTCPQCCSEDFFYNFIHRTCESCGFPWGNIFALINDIRVRKYYYKEGEID
jgi:ribosomal protein L37E